MSWSHRTSVSERLFLAACMQVAISGDAFGFIATGGELAQLPGFDGCRGEIVIAGEALILIKVQEAIDLYAPLSRWDPRPKGGAEPAHRRLKGRAEQIDASAVLARTREAQHAELRAALNRRGRKA